MDWLILKEFVRHSGDRSQFKIECDGLTDVEIETFAWLIAKNFEANPFSHVVAIPRGGDRLASALDKYCNTEYRHLLIVDDVLSTGASMKRQREEEIKLDSMLYVAKDRHQISGAVMFSLIKPPSWVYSVFNMGGFPRNKHDGYHGA